MSFYSRKLMQISVAITVCSSVGELVGEVVSLSIKVSPCHSKINYTLINRCQKYWIFLQ